MSSPAEPKWLLLEAVLAMHKLLITEHGGASEVRDRSYWSLRSLDLTPSSATKIPNHR